MKKRNGRLETSAQYEVSLRALRIFQLGMRTTVGLIYFFFSSRRRHTRLQGDWSSDVCSSDLAARPRARQRSRPRSERKKVRTAAKKKAATRNPWRCVVQRRSPAKAAWPRPKRSEERRVGKEGRSRWSPYH